MREASETPRPHPELDLGVIQAMLDISLALEQEALVGRGKRVRHEDGFLAADPDHYRRLAQGIIDLVSAHPAQGPEQLAEMLETGERSAWRRQDRLPARAASRRKM